MEQEEDFQNALSILTELEQQFFYLSSDTLAKANQLVNEDIQVHFDRCMKALIARRDWLLHDADLKFQDQKFRMETKQGQLKSSIDGCRKLIESGSAVYANQRMAALYCWRGANEFKCESTRMSGVDIKLTENLLKVIANHGTITIVEELEKVSYLKAGEVTTFAGSKHGRKDEKGSKAQFYGPHGICFNPLDQCLYVCDSCNHDVRKINMQGEVTSFIPRKEVADFNFPVGIATYHKENSLFVTSQGHHTIKKITSQGVVSVFAGRGTEGCDDGVGTESSFDGPCGLTIDQLTGNIYVADFGNHSIRRITQQGVVSTLAGSSRKYGLEDGVGTSAKFNNPCGIYYSDKYQSLFICDYSNNKLRSISLNGEVTTICDITKPSGVAVTASGSILVSSPNKITKLSQKESGQYDIENFVGNGKAGGLDGKPFECLFNNPRGIVIDESANLCFVVDQSSSRVRKISLIPWQIVFFNM